MINFDRLIQLLYQYKQLFIKMIKATGFKSEIDESLIEVFLSDIEDEDDIDKCIYHQIALQYEGDIDERVYFHMIMDLDCGNRKLIFNRFIMN